MKAKLVILLLTAVFATTGSTCINDGFLVALNLAITGCHAINPGTSLNFGGTTVVVLRDQIDESYRENIRGARYYDIRVHVEGVYGGSVSGTAAINGIPLLVFGGTWAEFSTPQSLLGSSQLISPQNAGVSELVRVLNQFAANPGTTAILSSSGTLSGPSPVPAGLSVCVEVLAQADAEVN